MKKAIILLLIFSLLALPGCTEKTTTTGEELTIAAFMDSQFLQFAAKKYEEIHDGVKININTYSTKDEKDVSKYSQIINTALMSGKGEDIIDVSHISWAKLAEKNKLMDLTGAVNLDPAKYYQNVIDAYLYKGKRYTIPLCFAFEAYHFDDALTGKENPANLMLNGLLDLSDRYTADGTTMLFDDSGYGMGQTTLAYKLFTLNFKDFVDVENKKANVDGAKFISLLESVQSIADRLIIKKSGDVPLIHQFLLYSPAMSHLGTVDYNDMFLLTNEAGQGSFSTIGFLPAVNANSTKKERTLDFIQFLISEEMQSSPELMYCPVNKTAAEEAAKLVFADAKSGGYMPDGFDEDSLERNIAKFNGFAGYLSVVEYSDDFIRDFVLTEMTRYFQGEESADQAAKNLQSKLNTYLKE